MLPQTTYKSLISGIKAINAAINPLLLINTWTSPLNHMTLCPEAACSKCYVRSSGGRYGKNIISQFNFHDFITILCHVGFTILSYQCSQNNVPIIKTRPFKVTHIKWMVDIKAKVGEDTNIFHYFMFVIKKHEQSYTLQIHIIYK